MWPVIIAALQAAKGMQDQQNANMKAGIANANSINLEDDNPVAPQNPPTGGGGAGFAGLMNMGSAMMGSKAGTEGPATGNAANSTGVAETPSELKVAVPDKKAGWLNMFRRS